MFDTRRQPPQRPGDLYEGDDPVISELANQPAPNRDDAEKRRREYAINRGSAPANWTGNPLHADTASQFQNDHYNTTIQERDKNRGIQNASKITGTTFQVSGKTIQMGGKATKKTGKGTMRAGAALSATGIGAVAGVPLMIAGGGVTAIGAGAEVGGNTLSTGGKILKGKRRRKKSIDATRLALRNVGRAKGIAVGFWSSAWAFNTWLLIQMPLAVLSIIGLGVWYYLDYLRLGNDRAWWEAVLGAIANTFSEAIFLVFGWDLESLMAIFFLAYIALIFFALLTIFITILGFGATFCRPLSGRMAGLKWGTLLLCIVGYMTPGFNLFPWILIYIWVVALYPR